MKQRRMTTTRMTTRRRLINVIKVMKGDAVVLSVDNDTLKVDAGNKSADDLKVIAGTFFKSAYKLTS